LLGGTGNLSQKAGVQPIVTIPWEYYDPRLILRFLHPPARIAFLLLILLLLYAFCFAVVASVRIRSLRRRPIDRDSVRPSLEQLNRRATNLRQMIRVMFFLFGSVFFQQLPAAFTLLNTTDSTRDWIRICENMATYFEFAAEAFLIFFAIQCLPWFISSRIGSALRRL
jgi:hypothetical protein